MESGSIFHEGVWPPPSERSRLEDPILAGSNVDLHSIVDDVMGANVDNHGRWSSADTASSSSPLLASGMAGAAVAAGPSGKRKGGRSSLGGAASETSPLNPTSHNRQQSADSSGGYSDAPYSDYTGLPPGAAPPIVRGKSISTTGSPRQRAIGPSGFGSLMVVNASPEEDSQENAMPLVDLTPAEEIPREIPPLYHLIRRDTEDGTTRTNPLNYSQLSLAIDGVRSGTATPGPAETHNELQREENDGEEVSPIMGQAL